MVPWPALLASLAAPFLSGCLEVHFPAYTTMFRRLHWSWQRKRFHWPLSHNSFNKTLIQVQISYNIFQGAWLSMWIYKFHKELHSMSGLPDMHEHISSCSALLFCYIPTRCGFHWCKCLIVNWVTNFVQWSHLYWRFSVLFIRLHKKQTSQSLTYSANWSFWKIIKEITC